MEQLKKRMARERQEREDEFRLKEEQIRRERTLREQSMRKRNDRLSFLRRANTSTGLFSSYTSPSTTYSSYSAYSTDNSSPTNSHSYSTNLASKWVNEDQNENKGDEDKTENLASNNKNGDNRSETIEDNESSLPFSSYKSSYKGPGLSFSSEEYSYSSKKSHEADNADSKTFRKETPQSSAEYLGTPTTESDFRRSSSYSGGERLSSRYFPNTSRETSSPGPSGNSEGDHLSRDQDYRRSSYGNSRSKSMFSDGQETSHFHRDSPSPGSFKSFDSVPFSSHSNSDRQYGSRRGSEYGSDTSKSADPSAGSSKTYDFSPFSNYLNSTPDLRYGGSRGTSPVFGSYRSETFSPPTTNSSSRSTDDLLSEDTNHGKSSWDNRSHYDEYLRESWSKSLPKRRSSRLEEQMEWEKQFQKERERRMRAREEEEQREEERLKLELKNQQILQNQKKMEKKRWEESFASNFTKPTYDDQHSTGFVEFKQYHFRSPSVESPENSNGTSSFTFKYNTSYNNRSPSPVKQFRSVHVQTTESNFRKTLDGD